MKISLQNLGAVLSPPPKKRIIFIHLPKTAGSSVRKTFKALYFNPIRPDRRRYTSVDGREAYEVQDYTNVNRESIKEIQSLVSLSSGTSDFIVGHFRFNKKAYEMYKNEFAFICIFRNPVERLISHYFYDRYIGSENYRNRINKTFDEFLDSDEGATHGRLYVDYFAHDSIILGHSLNEQISEAVENVDKLHLVGRVENMEHFRIKLEKMIRRRIRFGRVNKSPAPSKKNDVSAAQREKAEALCKPDMAIYQKIIEIENNSII